MTKDAADYGARRARMVEEQIVDRGIRSGDVLAAMRTVPRHLFVPADLLAEAYLDSPLPIGHGQTISQPYMVALMTELLAPDVRSRVLEVGSGSGYQTAVLAELAGEVYAVERLAPLAERARITLTRLAYRNVRTVIADGTRGWPEAAPFEAILVAAAAPAPPPALLAQIADGGRLVIPLGSPQRDQVLTIFTRTGEGLSERQDTRCRFVPLIGDTEVEGGRQGAAAPGVRAAAAAALGYPEENVAMKVVGARVYGIVQGVAYRDSACAEARHLGLSGWVSNLSDGSVALRIQGEPALVDALLGWCRVGPPAARVTRVEVSDVEHGESVSGFEVR